MKTLYCVVILAFAAPVACPAPALAAGESGGSDTPVSSDTEEDEGVDQFTLQGRVIGQSGRPVAGASVLPQSRDRPAPRIPEIAVTTNESGAYRWTLPAGRWTVTVYTLDGNEASDTATTRKGEVARLDFVIPGE